MLSHQKTHDNLTGEINHFITSIFCGRKKGKGAEVLALWDLLSFSLPHCYLFYFHCSLIVSALPKTKAFFLLFNFILHCASQTSHDWNSRNDLFLTACHITANQAPYLPAQECDSPTVWWRLFWTDRLEWYQTTSRAGSAHLCRCHFRPLSQSVAPFQPPTQQSISWCTPKSCM